MTNRPAYFDYQATTPVDRAVLDAMIPYFIDVYGNPHSGDHGYASEAAEAVELGRRQVADLIGAQARELVFTSGATESNNLLIAGTARAAARQGRRRIVTAQTEHKSVLEVVRSLSMEGFDVVALPVEASGAVAFSVLDAAVTPDTGVVSLMAANNEIGVLHPLAAIGTLCRARGAAFHTDAAQALGKTPLNVGADQIDLMSMSAHKVYGPKGVGAAFVSRGSPFRPDAVLQGGGQEGGLRPGTLPTPLCVGFGRACVIAGEVLPEEAERLLRLRGRFLARLVDAGLEFEINGNLEHRLPGNLNVSFAGVDAEALLMTVRDRVAAASGSACTAQALDPSYVVAALGAGIERAETAVRFGFGRPTTAAEVDAAALVVVDAVRKLRRVSYTPAWVRSA